MRWSSALIPTLKEVPNEAEIASHKLMLRAGIIRKVASGVYNIMPLGFRTLLKIIAIIRDEMNKAGAEELLMPIMTPSELWKETGRWDVYGKELMRLKDRADREFALGPTHEEVITDIARSEIKSYRDLPKNFYQIQVKFRDEIRPRFGIMRAREFMMKDAYSFHRDEKSAEETYRKMVTAYNNIFTKCGLNFRAVEAESGAIGGSFSHEFMVLANTGEEAIINCVSCGYAANRERAEGVSTFAGNEAETLKPLEKVKTPGEKTVEAVTKFLKKKPSELIKTLIYICDNKPVAVLIKGDEDFNENKIKRQLGFKDVVMADPKTVETLTKSPVGYAGPVGLTGVKIFADNAIKKMKNAVVGGNEKDFHYINANVDRDFKVDKYMDLRFSVAGDKCVKCGKDLTELRGIEVGHTFKLGLKYSKVMKAEFLDEDGKRKPMVMGCYGIGVTRIIGAAIEQRHDENGIIWPKEIAPYTVLITAINYNDAGVKAISDELYNKLKADNIEVLLDDRDVSAGFKFKDADLVGIPFRITIGNKAVKEGLAEIYNRKTKVTINVKIDETIKKIRELLK